ncbi:hypothetical protein RRG08_050578 [Elysia crispata]|uniref:Uncharacterized protein n=1 Tax=Elysia crispata TaxID=231223 RepID=A0AAE0Z779_9GAST|nr:hypothetical protein RRG08_050578 [Elysia crispata]
MPGTVCWEIPTGPERSSARSPLTGHICHHGSGVSPNWYRLPSPQLVAYTTKPASFEANNSSYRRDNRSGHTCKPWDSILETLYCKCKQQEDLHDKISLKV